MRRLFQLTVATTLFLALAQTAFAIPKLTETRVSLGKLKSRAIVRVPEAVPGQKQAVVIMLPGSGPNGPEEIAVPQQLPDGTMGGTLDGKFHALFTQLSDSLNLAGVITIAVGKPGVEYFSPAHPTPHSPGWFYDLKVSETARWTDLLADVGSAVEFALKLPNVDPSRVYILGHSEGTQIAVDYAATDARIKGLLLLGYYGISMGELLDWQLFRRQIEFYLATDVDTDHDGKISHDEEAVNDGFHWTFKPGQDAVSFSEVEAFLRADKSLYSVYKTAKEAPLYSNGIFARDPIYKKTAQLKQDLIVIQGEMDMQTPVREVETLGEACRRLNKQNCWIRTLPGLGHDFSQPMPPRRQPVLDMTIGPVDNEMLNLLFQVAKKI